MISAYSGGNHSRWIPVLATSDIRSEKRRSRAAWCQHKWPDSVQVHRVSSCSPVKEGEQTQFLQSLFSERESEVGYAAGEEPLARPFSIRPPQNRPHELPGSRLPGFRFSPFG